jgi:hypothetical protein
MDQILSRLKPGSSTSLPSSVKVPVEVDDGSPPTSVVFSLDWHFGADLKLSAMVLGHGGVSCSVPSPFCTWVRRTGINGRCHDRADHYECNEGMWATTYLKPLDKCDEGMQAAKMACDGVQSSLTSPYKDSHYRFTQAPAEKRMLWSQVCPARVYLRLTYATMAVVLACTCAYYTPTPPRVSFLCCM